MSVPKPLLWHEYLEKLTKEDATPDWLPDYMGVRLKSWQNRFKFYAELDAYSFKSVAAWQKKNKLSREGQKLHQALIALQELRNSPEHQVKEPQTEMEAAILRVIDIQLMKLEMTQLKMLSKAQNLKRLYISNAQSEEILSLEDLEKLLNEKREESRLDIEKKSGKSKYSNRAKQYNLENTSLFFQKHERKIHYSKHFKITDRFADAINAGNAFRNVLTRIGDVVTALGHAMTTAGTVLNTVPFVNAFTSSIPIFILAAKAWINRSSWPKRIAAAVLVGVIIGGVITMGFATTAAAGIAVSIMAIGIYVKHVHPWLTYLKEIFVRKKELSEIDSNIGELEKAQNLFKISKNSEQKVYLSYALNSRDRQFLLVKLEQHWLRNQNNPKKLEELSKLKQAILFENINDLSENATLKTLLGDKSLPTFLLEETKQRKKDIETEIKYFSALEKRKRLSVINGVFAVIGATLLCIPHPVTMILGASILLTTAMVTIALSYRLDEKIVNAFKKLFAKKTKTTDEDNNDVKKEFTNDLANKHLNSLATSGEKITLKPEPKPVLEASSNKGVVQDVPVIERDGLRRRPTHTKQ